ncbi:unnamed protein product [Musa textilis]
MFDALSDDKRFKCDSESCKEPSVECNCTRLRTLVSHPSRDPVARTNRTPIQKGSRKSRFNPRLIPPATGRDALSHCPVSFQHQISIKWGGKKGDDATTT